MILKRYLPLSIAISFGLLTLIGLLAPLAPISSLLLNWAGLLLAVALILGVLNLFSVHLKRLFSGRDVYSGILVLSMLAVFALALLDGGSSTSAGDGVRAAFTWIIFPLEAALASLLAFFLLFAGFRLVRRQPGRWSLLFLLTAALMLASSALAFSQLLPDQVSVLLDQFQHVVNDIIVVSGMRGILIGVALGTVVLSIRVLVGLDRPYSQ